MKKRAVKMVGSSRNRVERRLGRVAALAVSGNNRQWIGMAAVAA